MEAYVSRLQLITSKLNPALCSVRHGGIRGTSARAQTQSALSRKSISHLLCTAIAGRRRARLWLPEKGPNELLELALWAIGMQECELPAHALRDRNAGKTWSKFQMTVERARRLLRCRELPLAFLQIVQHYSSAP